MKNLRILTLCLFALFIGVDASTALVEHKLISPDQSSQDKFGIAVAVSIDVVVIGAVNGNPLGVLTGSAYVYYRNQGGGDAWGHVATLTASDLQASSRFGAAVDIDGDLIIIGAPDADASGATYGFSRNHGGDANWGLAATLTASDGANGDQFGTSIAKDGSTIVVGAPFESGAGSSSGAAYIYFTPSGEIFNDGFEGGDSSVWDSTAN